MHARMHTYVHTYVHTYIHTHGCQVVPAGRINIGRNMQLLLRDLAAAVYAKGRVRPRRRIAAGGTEMAGAAPRAGGAAMDLAAKTHSFFSAGPLVVKDSSRGDRTWSPRLREPALVAAMRDGGGGGGWEAAGGVEAEEEGDVLHCCYVWSDDGLCLGAALTDGTGEMLETFSSLFSGTHSQAAGSCEAKRLAIYAGMLEQLWQCVHDWIGASFARPVRLVVGVLGAGLDMPRDLANWRALLERARCGRAGSMVKEVAVVQLGVQHSLQLLSHLGGALARETKTHEQAWEAWPAPPEQMEAGGAGKEETWLLKCATPVSFPPAVPGLAAPLATAVLVTSCSPRDHELDARRLWPTMLDLSLHIHVSAGEASASGHQAALAEVAREYHALSWATTQPSQSSRQSVLPLHFVTAKRLVGALASGLLH